MKVGTTETPDLDDIPNMEEDDLEEGDNEATAAPKVSVIPSAGVVDAGYVVVFLEVKKSADDFFVVLMWKPQGQSASSSHIQCNDHI